MAIAITKTIAATEHKYHDELNRGFTKLSEGEFKALRRQLPVTRQKVEWEKIGGYRVRFVFLLFIPYIFLFFSGFCSDLAFCFPSLLSVAWWFLNSIFCSDVKEKR